jgi:FkbM family methyltransferase
MRLTHYARQVRVYWHDTATPRDFMRLMQVRLSQSKIGPIACPRPRTNRVNLRSFGGPVWLRSHTTDISVLDEHLIGDAYADAPSGLRTIVDLGAYTGLTARWLLARNPDARIVCVEPEPGNVAVLERNLAPVNGRADLVQACIGGHERTVSLTTGNGSWAFEMVEGCDVQVTTMARLIREHGLDRIDLLKSNVEGAEREVFADPRDWADRVGFAIIEWHGQDGGHVPDVTGWELLRRGQSHDDCEFLVLGHQPFS